MKDSDSSLKHTPFGNLKNLLRSTPLPRPVSSADARSDSEPASNPENGEKVFLEAMQDVQPISEDKHAREYGGTRPPETDKNVPEKGVMVQLENLVKYGEGFIISNTPEYIEGTGATYVLLRHRPVSKHARKSSLCRTGVPPV